MKSLTTTSYLALSFLLSSVMPCLTQGSLRGSLQSSSSLASPPAPSPSFVLPLHVAPIYGTGRWVLEPTIEVAAGTPPQLVSLVLDTGSDLPVFYNASCTRVPDCGLPSTPKYDSQKSSTAKVQRSNGKQTYQYQAGNVTGYVATDTISFPLLATAAGGGHQALRVEEATTTSSSSSFYSVKDQEMLVVDDVSWRKSLAGLDKLPGMAGILGLGPTDTNGFVQSLLNQGIEMMTVRLERGSGMHISPSSYNYSRTTSSPAVLGHVQFGGYDKLNPENRKPTWAKNCEIGLPNWVVYMDDVLANGKSTGKCGGTFCQAMFDTGAGEIDLEGAELPHIPIETVQNCSDKEAMEKLPNITLVISNTSFTLEPMDYLLRLPNGTCQSVIGQVSDETLMQQRAGVNKRKFRKKVYGRAEKKKKVDDDRSSSSLGYAWFDIGLQFTSRVTTIYDFKNLRMGFIQHD